MSGQYSTWWHKPLLVAWIGTIALAAVYVNSRPDGQPTPPGWTVWQAPGPTRAVLLTAEGIYAGGVHGLFRLEDDETTTPIEIPGTRGDVIINALARDAGGRLWVGHHQGLSIRTDSGWITLGEAAGLPHAQVFAITFTADGSAWLGTAGGAVRLPISGPWDRTTMTVLTARDGLLHDSVSAILEDPQGGLWFGNRAASGGGLSRLADGRWAHWTTEDGLPHANVTSLMLAREGQAERIWVGCGRFEEGGAAVFASAGGQWRLERAIPLAELAGPKVRSLHQDRQGRIWLGSEYDGVAIRRGGRTVRVLTPSDGLPGWEIMSITEASDGTMWLGTPGGVVRIAPSAVTTLVPPQLAAVTGAAP